jgi:hypothetical protein
MVAAEKPAGGGRTSKPADRNRMRKITVELPETDLTLAQEYTGRGITETIRAAIKKFAEARTQHEFRKLRGTYQFKIDLDELREDRK